MINNLPQKTQNVLRLCSDIALKSGIRLYLVGGVVRDLLLSRNTFDVDVCMEFDAIKFAEILCTSGIGKIIQVQAELHTAKVEFEKGVIIDFASTRRECYPRASHLPVITDFFCPLEQDILRRDFTVNSLAISLCKDNFGEIIDYIGGLEDLKQEKIRILHEKSFIDDPSRIVRALKYAQRLNFKLEDSTKSLMGAYLDNLPDKICYSRIMSEIKQVFEQSGIKVFKKFYEWDMEKLFYAQKNNKYGNLENIFDKFNVEKDYFNLFAFIFTKIKSQNLEKIISQLNLDGNQQKIIMDLQNLLRGYNFEENIDIYNKFFDVSPAAIALYYAETLNSDAVKFVNELKDIRLEINGNDLISLGLIPSNEFKLILRKVLNAKLEGKIKTKEDELELVKKLIAKSD